MKPLAIDLFCGKGGWTQGLLAIGFRVIGFDIANMGYHPDAQLVLQDVLTLHGSQFKDAALIVASPPCQEFSYMAMPWSKAKAKQRAIEADVSGNERRRLTRLFDACFRIQREASEAAGRHIPLVVENVCGAQKWVGRARWHYGSFYLWGDVPALMPIVMNRRMKFPADCGPRRWDEREYVLRLNDGSASGLGHREGATKVPTEGMGRRTDVSKGARFTSRDCEIERVSLGSGVRGLIADYCGDAGSDQQHARSIKNGGDWFGSGADCSLQRRQNSKGSARKAASAQIAMIPFELARHIGACFLPS